jgi:hypothetical protein
VSTPPVPIHTYTHLASASPAPTPTTASVCAVLLQHRARGWLELEDDGALGAEEGGGAGGEGAEDLCIRVGGCLVGLVGRCVCVCVVVWIGEWVGVWW